MKWIGHMFIPIGILCIVYTIIHTIVLGIPFSRVANITEDDVEKEVIRVFRKYKTADLLDISKEEELELRQIERVLEDEDEYV
jgi:hypothetical protein